MAEYIEEESTGYRRPEDEAGERARASKWIRENLKEPTVPNNGPELKPGYDNAVGEIWRHRAAGNEQAAQAVMEASGIQVELEGDNR